MEREHLEILLSAARLRLIDLEARFDRHDETADYESIKDLRKAIEAVTDALDEPERRAAAAERAADAREE